VNPGMRAIDPGRPGHFIKHLDDKVRGDNFESLGLRIFNLSGLTHGPWPIMLQRGPR
jgi:hypothetical protein